MHASTLAHSTHTHSHSHTDNSTSICLCLPSTSHQRVICVNTLVCTSIAKCCAHFAQHTRRRARARARASSDDSIKLGTCSAAAHIRPSFRGPHTYTHTLAPISVGVASLFRAACFRGGRSPLEPVELRLTEFAPQLIRSAQLCNTYTLPSAGFDCFGFIKYIDIIRNSGLRDAIRFIRMTAIIHARPVVSSQSTALTRITHSFTIRFASRVLVHRSAHTFLSRRHTASS